MSTELSIKELKKSPDWLTVNKLSKIILSSPSKIESKLYELQYKMPDFIKIILTPEIDLVFLHKDYVNEFIALAGFKSRIECDLEEKGPDWLSANELKKQHSITNISDSSLLKKLKDMQENSHSKISEKIYKSSIILCIHQSYVEEFLIKSGLGETNKKLPNKGSDWLSTKELNKTIQSSISVIREKLKDLRNEEPHLVKKMQLEDKSIGYCIHKDNLQKFLDFSGLHLIPDTTKAEKSPSKPELPAYTKEQIELIFGRKIHDKIVYKGKYKKNVEEALKKAEEIEQRKMSVYISQESKMH